MIELYFEKLSCIERINEPCSVAVPFPKGELLDIHMLSVTDGKKDVEVQPVVTATWPDGSIKWALIHFFADLPANADKKYFCEIKKHTWSEEIEIKRYENIISVDTGNIFLELETSGNIFRTVKNEHMSLSGEEIYGPVINGKWRAYVTDGWEVLKNGAVTAVLQAKGKHFDESGNGIIDFLITIQVYKNTDWFKIDYKILNKESEDISLHSITLDLKLDGEDVSFSLGKSNYKTDLKTGENSPLTYTIDGNHLMYEANEHFPEVMYGTFFADWRKNNKCGVCATLYQAFQNYPKALCVDSSGIKIDIIPHSDEGILLYEGMAKTHTIFLHMHDNKQDVNLRSLQFQMPDRPVLEPSVYKRSNVFPDIYKIMEPDMKLTVDVDVECALINKFDFRGRAFGILHWGDSVDHHYTDQGRGDGAPVYTNNEYDFPHAAMLMYARTSERRMLDYLIAGARHWMDVDVCHHSNDPLRRGGMIAHSAEHVSGKVEISHEWVEGLFDYYHMTGDRFAYDTAIEIGNNIKRILKEPRYQNTGEINARETGWALRALTALYTETGDDMWLRDANFIVSHFEAWKDKYGKWLSPYTDHTAIRIPFMISIAVGSLMRYYKINPLPKIREMIIDAVDDMLENCISETGLFYYKELPSLRRLGNNTIPLEALTYAYELTNDKKYLIAGVRTFVNNIKTSLRSSYSMKKVKYNNAVTTDGDGSKGVAQSFFPVAYFYTAVLKEGIQYKI